ncbi:MAG: ABC transporter permease subunit [Propionibacteriales bacterium]|nr:ABC transporter permease subunit [Propionibacteriales bacterium]
MTDRPEVAGRDGFHRLLLAEWTKLRSVPRWVLTVVATVVVTALVALLVASSSNADANEHRVVVGPDGQPVSDEFHFVHQPLPGDGNVTARVVTQDDSNAWAKAGVMVKEGTESGSPYAAMMVTPGNGLRLQANFSTDLAGAAEAEPRWLRLTRSGSEITGYESPDGSVWSKVGMVELDALPPTVEVGLFVASPNDVQIHRQLGSIGVGETPTAGKATFDNVSVVSAQPSKPGAWADLDVGQPGTAGASTESDGMFTVTGSGDVASDPPDDDVVLISLSPGVLVAVLAIVALGVVFATSEYNRGMIRTTLAASPRRGPVLAAKAVVIGGTTFVAGLLASVSAFLLAQPILRANGYGPPAFPEPSLSDGPVLRAVVGTAAALALIAVLSLGAGVILRRSAGAIAGVLVLLILPLLVAHALPPGAAAWLMRLTPAGGFAIQQTVDRSETALEPWAMIGPWAGFGVLCAYTAVTLGVAFWLLRRRDA